MKLLLLNGTHLNKVLPLNIAMILKKKKQIFGILFFEEKDLV
jgi:hypothetical protein